MDQIQDIKENCEFKLSQGDVNIYRLKTRPNLETKPFKGSILVTGDGGHTHAAVGAKAIGQTPEGQWVLEIGKKGAGFEHNGKHQPAFELEEGFYLVDRAREKGMLNDMVAPVAD